jgi:3-phenylpropionate/trans-cinnamate dioxygenase ferredoxin component
MAAVRLCGRDDVPVGEARRFDAGDIEVCVVNLGDDGFRAVAAECSHAHAYLDEGEVDTELATIECPLHGSTFDLQTGAPKTLPATQPVASYPLTVADGDVMIEV